MIVRVPDIIRPLFGKVIWRKILPSSKVIYLTFDDGPVPEVTEKVLTILHKYGCKATFFCVGDNVRKHPDIYRKIIAEGHHTGNHTFHHLKGFKTKTVDYLKDVDEAANYIQSDLFRPPYGRIKWSQLRKLKKRYQVVYWDVLTYDYNASLSPEKIFENVRKFARNGSVIVFHDSLKSKKNVLEALPISIEYLKNEGFQFGVL